MSVMWRSFGTGASPVVGQVGMLLRWHPSGPVPHDCEGLGHRSPLRTSVPAPAGAGKSEPSPQWLLGHGGSAASECTATSPLAGQVAVRPDLSRADGLRSWSDGRTDPAPPTRAAASDPSGEGATIREDGKGRARPAQNRPRGPGADQRQPGIRQRTSGRGAFGWLFGETGADRPAITASIRGTAARSSDDGGRSGWQTRGQHGVRTCRRGVEPVFRDRQSARPLRPTVASSRASASKTQPCFGAGARSAQTLRRRRGRRFSSDAGRTGASESC